MKLKSHFNILQKFNLRVYRPESDATQLFFNPAKFVSCVTTEDILHEANDRHLTAIFY